MLKQKLEEAGLEFDGLFYDRCTKYKELLQEWSAVHNLTRSTSDNEINGNIYDSVFPLKFLNSFESMADIGTGAGYPGMLLAIARPEAKVSLIEPKAKRVAFLNFVKASLKLENVTVVHKRVEEVNPTSFELITSRAVTDTSLLLSLTNHLRDSQTEYLFYKGSSVEEEIKDIENYELIKRGDTRHYFYIKRKGLFWFLKF